MTKHPIGIFTCFHGLLEHAGGKPCLLPPVMVGFAAARNNLEMKLQSGAVLFKHGGNATLNHPNEEAIHDGKPRVQAHVNFPSRSGVL